jgi:C-terminal processing protease CtpA/Prc
VSAQGRTFREAIGLQLRDPEMMEEPISFGGGGVGVMEKYPKITAMSANTCISRAGVSTGEKVYKVDGREVEKSAEVYSILDKKKVPGRVSLKVGKTKYDSRDIILEIVP